MCIMWHRFTGPTCSVCLLSLECSTADTVARETPGLISEGTKELASYERKNQTFRTPVL